MVFQNFSSDLLYKSIIFGNSHAFICLIDNFPLCNLQMLVKAASAKGFCRLANIILNIINGIPSELSDRFTQSIKYQSDIIVEIKDIVIGTDENTRFDSTFVNFGNISIFKIGLQINKNQSELEKIFCYCIQKDLIKFLDYYFNELVKKDFKITQSFIRRSISTSLTKKDPFYLNYLIEKIKCLCPLAFKGCGFIKYFLKIAISANNIDYVKIILDLVKELNITINITSSLIDAALNQSTEICQYFVDQNYPIDYSQIFDTEGEIGKINRDIFLILYNNADNEIKNELLSYFLIPAITNNNKDLVEFISSKKEPSGNALIQAVDANNFKSKSNVCLK